MSFDHKNLSVLSYANGFTQWVYKTDDSINDIENKGYFQAKNFIANNDVIIACTNEGVFNLYTQKDKDGKIRALKTNTMPRCDIEELKSEIKHLKDLQTNQDKEVERLRELLKECKNIVANDLITRINAAIGESEE